MSIIKSLLKVIGIGILVLLVSVFLYLYFPSRQSPIPFDYNGWENGSVRHILPQFDHHQLLMKVSFDKSFVDEPQLWINDIVTQGKTTSPDDKFWQFYTEGLRPSTAYTLQIKNKNGVAITDEWSIKTFPHPDSTANDLRILKYTCAGGISESLFGQEVFLDMKYRRALLKRALQENPRIVIANGDHVYWDQKTSDKSFLQKLLKFRRNRMYGSLDLNQLMISDRNYPIFKNIIDDQIVELYGCHLREKSVYFITDDHDLLENDDAIEEKGIVSFPPDQYMINALGATQYLYYPEFLSSVDIKGRHWKSFGKDSLVNSDYGQLRYGNLIDMTMFDAKGSVTVNSNQDSKLVLELIEKAAVNSALQQKSTWHMVAPSSPFGWTAGKWLEWYPDILDGEVLTKDKEKYLWKEGWWNQHQRLLTAFHKRKNPTIILQGDLHMASYGMIQRSGDLDFSNNPIPVITTAPLGSGKLGFPSSFRGVGATVPIDMDVDEIYVPAERNGFTILNVSQEVVAFDIYTWRLPEPLEAIRDLKPSFSSKIMNTK